MIKFIKNLFKEKSYFPYCKECTACGESGCCSPLGCDYTFKGKYCKGYLKELKYTYELNRFILDVVYNNETKYKELIHKIENKEIGLDNKYNI